MKWVFVAMLITSFVGPLLAGLANARKVGSTEHLAWQCSIWLHSKDEGVEATQLNLANMHACEGYIRGYYDGWTTGLINAEPIPGTPSAKLCFPPGARLSYGQLTSVFVKWAEDHPQFLHLNAWQGVREAWADAWPCEGS